MNNQVCTSATSRRLREQGFPQPEPAPGQVWYTANDTPFIISLVIPESGFVSTAWPETGEFGTNKISALPSCTYAPTAPDILREVGHDYALVYAGGEPTLISTVEKRLPFLYKHPNPAEACAGAWGGSRK